MEVDNICPICLSKCTQHLHTLKKCGHVFHFDCISQSVQSCGRYCPLCRRDVIDQEFDLISSIDSYLYKDITSAYIRRCFNILITKYINILTETFIKESIIKHINSKSDVSGYKKKWLINNMNEMIDCI